MTLLEKLGIDLLPRDEIIALARELAQHLLDTSTATDPNLKRLTAFQRRFDELDAPHLVVSHETDDMGTTPAAL